MGDHILIPCENVSGITYRQIPCFPTEFFPDLPGAACKYSDEPDMFYPRGKDSARVIARAKAVCASCHVKSECLEWCLAWERRNGIQPGIWGGVTEWERRAQPGCVIPDTKGLGERCKAGHEMAGGNVMHLSDGGRRCRQCHREADARSHRSQRARRKRVLPGEVEIVGS